MINNPAIPDERNEEAVADASSSIILSKFGGNDNEGGAMGKIKGMFS